MMRKTDIHEISTDASPPLGAEVEEVDFNKFEGIGVPPRTAWLVSSGLYAASGSMFLILSLALKIVPTSLAYFSVAGLVMAGLCVVGSKRFPDAWWGGHFRSSCGMLNIGAAAMVIGNVHGATALVMLYVMLSVAYIYDLRNSLPYVIVGTAWIVVTFLTLIDDPTGHAIASGVIVGAISAAIIFSQQELRSIVRINRRLSITDPLTGAANVRRLTHALGEAVALGSEQSDPALFGMDLDDFKLVNDQFSHTRGDEVLKAVAAEIGDQLAPTDLLARRGGDEFAVLVLESHGRDLDLLREEIAAAITRARKRTCPRITPTGSVAYVSHVAGQTVEQLLERCDAALHEAKLEVHPERRSIDGDVVSIGRFQARSRGAKRSDQTEHRSDDFVVEELQMARSIRHALGRVSSWNVIAVMTLAASLAILGALATKTGSDVTGHPVYGAIVMLCMGGLAVLGAKRDATEGFLHAHLAAMVVMISLVEWQAGALRDSMADLYLLPIFAAFYALDAKKVLPYLAASLGGFAVALLSSDYAYSIPRIAVTGVVTLVMVGLLAKARRVTREFTAHAVSMSTVDPLTGVANLRGLRRGVTDAIDRCIATGERVALIAVDLDDFKSVNDMYSHTMGDRVLVAAANVIKNCVRGNDMVARRGGDEFVAVCVIDDELEVLPMLTRLGESISLARQSIVADVLPTASIGSVIWMPGESADTFLARADEELHGAKAVSHFQRSASRLRLA